MRWARRSRTRRAECLSLDAMRRRIREAMECGGSAAALVHRGAAMERRPLGRRTSTRDGGLKAAAPLLPQFDACGHERDLARRAVRVAIQLRAFVGQVLGLILRELFNSDHTLYARFQAFAVLGHEEAVVLE